jgi:hypothetical protein
MSAFAIGFGIKHSTTPTLDYSAERNSKHRNNPRMKEMEKVLESFLILK